jgi:hypothetical protein
MKSICPDAQNQQRNEIKIAERIDWINTYFLLD